MSKAVILCVDDEGFILDSLKVQLKHEFRDEYVYEVAESADEALEIIGELREEGRRIVAIVSDWLMPGIKGDEFLIKVHQDMPDVVKILLTGQADEDAVVRAQERANLHSFISKPWQTEQLVAAIKSGLDEYD